MSEERSQDNFSGGKGGDSDDDKNNDDKNDNDADYDDYDDERNDPEYMIANGKGTMPILHDDE